MAQTPTFEWAKNTDGYYGYGGGRVIDFDPFGNLYVIGNFEGKVDFDPGIGNFFLGSAGYNGGYVTKFDTSGNFLWARHFEGNSTPLSIAFTTSGNTCIAGTFKGIVDFEPGAGVNYLTSYGTSDIFAILLDTSGQLIWVKQFGNTNSHGFSISLQTDSSNNIYTSGTFTGTIDFDPGVGTYNLTAAAYTANTFVLKLDSAGNFIFAKQMIGDCSGRSIAIDASANIYTVGIFSDSTDFDPDTSTYYLEHTSSTDIFISKLNSTGNFVWAKKIGSNSEDEAKTIKIDASGNLYIVGLFSGLVDFNPGPLINNLASTGNKDIFILKLDANGNFIWVKRLGGAIDENINSISLDGAANIYAIGSFKGTVDFDPGNQSFNLTGGNRSIFILKLQTTGIFEWAKAIDATSNVVGNSIVADSFGNNYFTGSFTGECDFDPGAGSFNMIGENYIFNSKLDSSGNFVWSNSAGASSSILPKSITTDLSGNVYVTGIFHGTVDFDAGPSVKTLSTAPTDFSGDVFIAKFNSSGSLTWVKQIGDLYSDFSTSIIVNSSGYIYTIGGFRGTVDFNPGPGTFNLEGSLAYPNPFIIKLSPNGNFVWAKALVDSSIFALANSITLDGSQNIIIAGKHNQDPFINMSQAFLRKLNPSGSTLWTHIYGGGWSEACAVKTNAVGDIYISGNFSGNVDFDPGSGFYNLNSPVNYDIFISKLSGAGNLIWAKQLEGSTYYHSTNSIAIDGLNQLHIAGSFSDTVDFDTGPGINNLIPLDDDDGYVCKYDDAGNLIWAKQFKGYDYENVQSIALDDFGNVYSAGSFSNTDFDPGPGTFTLNSIGVADRDGFISKLDSAGNFVWALQLGGSKDDLVTSIAIDPSANIYSTGAFHLAADFDPGIGISNIIANGSPDFFLHKLSQCIQPSAIITPSGPTIFCAGDSVNLIANSGPGLSYQWKRNGLSISGATSPSFLAKTPGKYSVFVSNTQPCTAISNTITVKMPCIPIDPSEQRTDLSTELTHNFKVFPNPNKGIFVIDSKPGYLQIINAIGQIIKESILQNGEQSIDITDLADGVYILKIKTEESTDIRKMILNRSKE